MLILVPVISWLMGCSLCIAGVLFFLPRGKPTKMLKTTRFTPSHKYTAVLTTDAASIAENSPRG